MIWKPEGYSSVSPYLVVKDARALITFLKNVFDGVELRCYQRSDGSIMHAEVKVDDSVVMLGQSTDKWGASPSNLHVYVKDSQETYQRAIKAGAESVQEPSIKEGDPDRRGGVKDPSGNTWWMSTQL